MIEDYKLDNPTWNALNEVHEKFSITYDGIKFYKPEYCLFGGFTNAEMAKEGISTYGELTDSFFVIGEQPTLDSSIVINNELICDQMILKTRIELDFQVAIVQLRDEDQKNELFDLVSLVQPGYFKNKTVDLGRYYGIYKNGNLIAACGERMQMIGYTEISAIVTHPDHTRKGYAKQLIKYISDKIFEGGNTPYLHVLESNDLAINLYQKLGFTTRRKMSFWKLNVVGAEGRNMSFTPSCFGLKILGI